MTKAKLKIISGVLALAVVAGGVCSLGYASRNEDGKWFANGNLSSWHWSDKVSDELSDVNGNAVIGEGESNGVSLMSTAIPVADYDEYGIDTQAESAVIITATISPSATTNKTVTWSTDDTSGKVKVTPVEDNPMQATVQVLGAFDKQVTITCTANSNSLAKATCTVDYVKALKKQEYDYIINDKSEEICFSESLEYGKGTLTPTSAKGKVEFYWDGSSSFYTYLLRRHPTIKHDISFDDVECNSLVLGVPPEQSYSLELLMGTSDPEEIASIYNDIATYIATYCDDGECFTIAFLHYSDVYQYYNGVEVAYADDVIQVNCCIESLDNFTVNASDVTLSDGSLVFGANGQVQ